MFADPAAEHFNYDVAFDIRDLVTLEDVMSELELGPNGCGEGGEGALGGRRRGRKRGGRHQTKALPGVEGGSRGRGRLAGWEAGPGLMQRRAPYGQCASRTA